MRIQKYLQMKEIFFYFLFSIFVFSYHHRIFTPFHIQTGCWSTIVVVNGCSHSFIIWRIKPYGTEVKYCMRKFLFHHFQRSRFVSFCLFVFGYFSIRFAVELKYEMPSSFYHFNMGYEFGCNTHMVLNYYI